MFKNLARFAIVATLLVAFFPWPAEGQNPQCPTRPLGDKTNACASTAFVANAIAAIPSGGGGGIIPAGFASTDIQTAVNTACAAGGGLISLQDGDYTWASGASSVLIQCDNVWVQGSPGTRLLAPPDATVVSMFQVFGASGASTTVGSNAAQYVTSITLTSAAGFSIGDYIQIINTQAVTGHVWIMVTRVTNVVGNVITLNDPLAFPMTTSDTTNILVMTLRENIKLKNLRFYGNGNTGAPTRPCYCAHMLHSDVSDIYLQDFPEGGFQLDVGYANSYDNIKALNSGSGNESDVTMRAQTLMSGGRITSHGASGFGPQFQYTSWSTFSSTISTGADPTGTSRGVKLQGALSNTFGTLIGNNSGSTGVAISVGSSNNMFDSIITRSNEGAAVGNRVGVWFSSQDNTRNMIGALVASNNTDSNISVHATDTNNTVVNMRTVTPLNLGGTTNRLPTTDKASAAQMVFLRGSPTAAATVFGWNGQTNATEAASATPAPFGGTISRAFFAANPAPGVGNTLTFTMRKNAADQTVTCAITGAATTCNDVTNAFSFVAGDLLSVEIVSSASMNTTTFTGSFLMD